MTGRAEGDNTYSTADYIEELILKLENGYGARGTKHESKGFFVQVARSLPYHKVMEALSSTQDAVLATRAGEDREPVDNVAAYFTGTVKNIAEREGIEIL